MAFFLQIIWSFKKYSITLQKKEMFFHTFIFCQNKNTRCEARRREKRFFNLINLLSERLRTQKESQDVRSSDSFFCVCTIRSNYPEIGKKVPNHQSYHTHSIRLMLC